MSADKKKVKLIRNFNPDHNGECLGCDSPFEKDCECLYLVADEDPQQGDNALKGTEKSSVLEKVYVQEVEEGDASIGSGRAVPVKSLWKIIAEAKQISLKKEEIERIFRQDGSCDIEMNVFEGDGCGYRTPKLIDNKFIIHI